MAATAGAIKAGRAFVEIFADDTKLQQALGQIQGRLRRFGSALSSIGTKFLAFGTAGAGAFGLAIKAASNLQETMSKFDVVFGAASVAAKAWSDDFASQVGRSKREVAGFLAASQDLFVPLGFAADAAQGLSKQVTRLAFDLASFNNMADADTLRDLQAALTGSGEVMKKYGVIVSEVAVKQELLNQGLDPKLATQQEKVQARLNIIMAGTTAAQGDAIRTSDSFANQTKRLKGELEDAAATIGSALLPVVTPLVEKAAAAARTFGEWATENKETVVHVGQLAAGAALAGGAAISLGHSITLAATALGGLKAAVGFFPVLVGGVRAVSLAFVGMGISASGAWAAATLGVSLVIPALAAIGTGLAALQAKFGIFDPAIEAVKRLADRVGQRLAPMMERLGESISRVFASLEPLLPLIESGLVLAVEAFATVLETNVLPKISKMAAVLGDALDKAALLASVIPGISIGTSPGKSSAKSKGKAASSVPETGDSSVLSVPGLAEIDIPSRSAVGAGLGLLGSSADLGKLDAAQRTISGSVGTFSARQATNFEAIAKDGGISGVIEETKTSNRLLGSILAEVSEDQQ